MERAVVRNKRPGAALDGRTTCRVARAAAGGKDRHSKVVTARGVRDRRVRLSVPTAIQFYDVQDRLGVDQPSKAVEWLIRAAAAAIDALPSLDCSFFDAELSRSASETTSKGSSVLSLANNAPAETAAAPQTDHAYNRGAGGGTFAELLHCSANDGKPMQQQQQDEQPTTLAYYPAHQHPSSSHVTMTPVMSFETTIPQLAFQQEQQQQHPAVVFDRATFHQSNAAVAAPLWLPTHQHRPYLLQRFTSAPSADSAGLPFFLRGGGAPAPTSVAERRRLQFWDFKQERKT